MGAEMPRDGVVEPDLGTQTCWFPKQVYSRIGLISHK